MGRTEGDLGALHRTHTERERERDKRRERDDDDEDEDDDDCCEEGGPLGAPRFGGHPAPSLQQSGGAPNNYNIGEDKCISEDNQDFLLDVAKKSEDFANFLGDFNSTPEKFLEDKDLTKLVLSYHVIPSVVPYSDMEMALKPLFMSQVGVTTSV